MTMHDSNRVLAVDGGGTRCRFALWDNGHVTIVEKGPTNIITNFDSSVRILLEGLDSLSTRTHIDSDNLTSTPTFLGLSGLISAELCTRLKAVLPLSYCHIADDRMAALKGALDDDGIVAHCGTGSFFAAQIKGQTKFSGGWGAILGDKASAQWVGRQILAKTLEAVDGYMRMTDICEMLLARYEGSAGIVHFARSAQPHQFGSIAPEVTQFASRGDKTAQYIMEKGAHYLAEHIQFMGWAQGISICLTGGIGPYYKGYLPHALQKDLCAPKGEPLDGAIILAKELKEKLHHGCC